MYSVTVLSALLCISSGATFYGNSLNSDFSGDQALYYVNEYPTSEEPQKRLVREPPLIKRGIDPFSIPTLIKEPPLKRGDKRDSYVYPSTNSQLSDRIPLREPPLKRSQSLDDKVFVLVPEERHEPNGLANVYRRMLLLDQSTNHAADSEAVPHPKLRSQRFLSRIWWH
ncbi:hypothetical protein V3C99_002500 [Haemonchus contortus]|uniref:Uncharacterized protein n=1 Tax=Haemonchus contortus TaxID=6289 RepID=A0A7I4YBE8_HAECO|nr:Protein T21C12.3 [Haemonchus contortus]